MFKVESSIVINAPVADIYDWLDHPSKHHHWQHSLIESRQEDDRVVVHRKLLGRRFETHFHTVERVPNQLVRRKGTAAAGSPLSYDVEQIMRLEAVDGGSKVTITSDVDTKGLIARAVVGTFERVARREQESSLAHLKELVEADEELHGVLAKLPQHTGA